MHTIYTGVYDTSYPVGCGNCDLRSVMNFVIFTAGTECFELFSHHRNYGLATVLSI